MATLEKQNTRILLDRATAAGVGETVAGKSPQPKRTYQASVAGNGAVSAVIEIQVSNDKNNWLVMGEITLTGTDFATDGFVSDAPWPYTRAELKSITGTNAAADAQVGD